MLSARAIAVFTAYLERLGVELHGDAYVFRNRSGAPYSSDTLGDDFRDVRTAEFGASERRTIGHDFRRSGAVEAIVRGCQGRGIVPCDGQHAFSIQCSFRNLRPRQRGHLARCPGSAPRWKIEA